MTSINCQIKKLFDQNFHFRGYLPTFRAENTMKSLSFKVENNTVDIIISARHPNKIPPFFSQFLLWGQISH